MRASGASASTQRKINKVSVVVFIQMLQNRGSACDGWGGIAYGLGSNTDLVGIEMSCGERQEILRALRGALGEMGTGIRVVRPTLEFLR